MLKASKKFLFINLFVGQSKSKEENKSVKSNCMN